MKDLAQNRAQLQAVLHDVVDQVRKTAPSIYREAVETAKAEDRPAPRRGDFERFGIAVVTREAGLAAAGNAGMAFPIQSISKVFALEIALEAMGEKLWERMGREPSGDPFNSIIDLERDKGIPRNPLINAGALVVCDILVGLGGDTDQNRHVVGLIARMLDGQAPDLHPDVMKSDRMGGNLNRSLMFMTKHHGNLTHSVEEVMDAYIHQCAIKLDCRGLAKAGRFLMDDGTAGENGSVAAARRARRVLSIMMTCGLYDGAGEFAYRVGLPAKSGVGGGILAIVPERASIAVWSPALDPMGNSWLGTVGLELLAERTDWSVFGAIRH
ncbi:glutaminase A [Allomesorhizobium alhagi]|jgi:glutaminase|uniref:Glutaminase n=1 Tax=Mesorhizobium alhagi CCNWXJ12-2 TaxID=1107882 RepID=H0I0F2_9HYPH|nr:glutaminase A [Mesorhizobium alhagi]EHK53540.1 glutaminase [Mesorhizobium alhagi CCNWXJ12-2]